MHFKPQIKKFLLELRGFVIPVCSINPGHAEGLEDDDDDEGKCGRIVIKHCHKIVSTALSEHETDQKAHRTAAHWERWEKDKTTIRQTHKTQQYGLKPRDSQSLNNIKKNNSVTCKEEFVVTQGLKGVRQRGQYSCHGAEHGGQTQIEQHEEEQRRPEWTPGKQCHSFSERYER